MSDYWEALRKAVQRAVDDERIGRPAALRLTVHVAGGAPEAEAQSARLRTMAAGWFGGEPVSIYSAGGQDQPGLHALRWAGGQSALVAVSAGPGRSGGNLMLMGTRGTLYHEIDGAPGVAP